MGVPLGHDAVGVLHHHHGTIYHHADADGQARQGHQIGRQSELAHADEGHQHRQRQGHDHDQRRTQLAQEQEQDDRHQDRTLDQGPGRGPHCLVDQVGTLVDRAHDHALGQRVLDGGQLGLDGLDHVLGVLADAGQRHAQHHFFAIAGDSAKARRRRLDDPGDIAQVDRHAVLGFEHDRADVLGRGQQAQAAHQVLLATHVHHVAADLAVVGRQGRNHVGKAQAPGIEPLRVDPDLVLTFAAAPGADVVHARRCAQDQAHRPLLPGTQVHVGDLVLAHARSALDRVPEHLAQARAVRTHAGLAVTLGQAVADFLQPFIDQLPSEVDLHVVLEIDGDVGKTKQAHRADFLHLGQARQRGLHRGGQQQLDVFCRQARRFGIDVHLRRGHVREGVDGDVTHGAQAQEGHHGEDDQDQELVAQGEFDQAIQHGAPPRSATRASMTMTFSQLRLEHLGLEHVGALHDHPVADDQAVGDDGVVADHRTGANRHGRQGAIGLLEDHVLAL